MRHPDGRGTAVPVHPGRNTNGTPRGILADPDMTEQELQRLLSNPVCRGETGRDSHAGTARWRAWSVRSAAKVRRGGAVAYHRARGLAGGLASRRVQNVHPRRHLGGAGLHPLLAAPPAPRRGRIPLQRHRRSCGSGHRQRQARSFCEVRGTGPGAEKYPHIYGALPADAVTDVIAVSRDAAGRLVLPE